jgi:hypothetical protein
LLTRPSVPGIPDESISTIQWAVNFCEGNEAVMQIKTCSSAVQFGFKKSDRNQSDHPGQVTMRSHTETSRKIPWLKVLAALPLLGMLTQPAAASNKEERPMSHSRAFMVLHPYFQKSEGNYCNNGFAGDDNWQRKGKHNFSTAKLKECNLPHAQTNTK